MADNQPDYKWPAPEERSLLGKRISRVDGPFKVSGRAKYTYDVHRPGMLFGKVVRCPYPHAKVVSVDTAAAEKLPGVKAVHVVQGPGSEIFWAGDDIAAVAAIDEQIAADAARLIKVEYEQLPHFVDDFARPQNAPENDAPLSPRDLLGLLEDMEEPEIIELLQKRGIGFDVTPQIIQRLHDEEVGDDLIKAVQSAKKREAPKAATNSPYKKDAVAVKGKPKDAFQQADAVVEGMYGCPVITHCCLESHGSIAEWTSDDQLFVHISTQNVSGVAGEYARALNIPRGNVTVHQDHIGGGFGSKFGADRWGIYTAQLSKKAGGKPVRVMLERDAELTLAGCRPSIWAQVKVAAKKDGTLLAWESDSWSTGGPGGGGAPPMPYVFNFPNQRKQHTAVATNIGPARAWRAPNHPQGCLVTMGAIEDLAAKLNMDPLDLFLKNLNITAAETDPYHRADTYREELKIAAELIGWKQNWRPRGTTPGPVKRGLGLSIHTWGGRGHDSQCALTIGPDGSVDMKMATQDLGVGTRTAIIIIAADTLGLPMDQVQLAIGDNRYPPSGPSGGSTTIGGVSSSARRASVDALYQLFEKAAP
ncbi:MAG TPA: molybdopterin cofactor-binding domain-containing protein, partial [Candidatus Angelobacter sp.]|nr:molybdopterin cofactor-binding domain-containing protein [Candidatus Angelobacter sp.]